MYGVEWIIILGLLCLGAGGGYLAARRAGAGTSRIRELEADLQSARQELTDYRQQVVTQFSETARKFQTLNDSYTDLHQQLARSSSILCGDVSEPLLAAPSGHQDLIPAEVRDRKTPPLTTSPDQEEPSAGLDEEPSAHPGKEPSAGLDEEPSADLDKEPSAGLDEEPSADLDKEPSADLGKEPSADLGKEPSAGLGKEPSATSSEATTADVTGEPSPHPEEAPPHPEPLPERDRSAPAAAAASAEGSSQDTEIRVAEPGADDDATADAGEDAGRADANPDARRAASHT